jgi:hypothetical protein
MNVGRFNNFAELNLNLMRFKIFLLAITLFFSLAAGAASRTNVKTGNWNDATVWGGTIPATGDNVTIIVGTTVAVNTNTAALASLVVNGTLSFDATGTARTLSVTGSCTVNSGGKLNCKLPGSATTHSFLFSGTSITNNGTFNLVNGTNVCNTTISGATAQSITGSGTYNFNRLTVNNSAGRMILIYSGNHNSAIYQKAISIASDINTKDSLIISGGLLVCCSGSNLNLAHRIASLKMGSGSSVVTSSLSASGVDTIRFNTAMIVNDGINSKVTLNILGTFNSPNMTQPNSGLCMAVIGPNCTGGTNSASKVLFDGSVNLPDLFCLIGNAKKSGGVEPAQPQITFGTNLFWQYQKSFQIPSGSKSFNLLSSYFGKLDSAGVFPRITLNGGSITSPVTFNASFKIFNASVQTSVLNSKNITAQFSNSQAEWYVNGSWKILAAASVAVHSDDTLLIKGNLDVADGGELAASETETNSSGYVAMQGPILFFEKTGQLLVENPTLGAGTKPDSTQDVTLKNRTASLNWNLTGISKNGIINYSAANAQTITSRGYKKLFITGGSFTKTLLGNCSVNDSLVIGTGITLANAGFTITALKNVVNNGKQTGTGEILLAGSAEQFLSGGNGDWDNIEFKNAAGFALNSAVNVSNNIKFTSGIVHTTSANLLSLTTPGKIFTGGTANSFVDGPLFARVLYSNDPNNMTGPSFTFPIGNQGNFEPTTIQFINDPSTTYYPVIAQYLHEKPPIADTSRFYSLSRTEYWSFDFTTDTFGYGYVTLEWDNKSGYSDTAGIQIAALTHVWSANGFNNFTGYSATSDWLPIWAGVFTFGDAVPMSNMLLESSVKLQGVSLQPNPAVSHLQLSWQTVQMGMVTINVYNLIGQKIMSSVQNVQAGFNQFQLDVSKLASGIYLLEMNDGKMKQTLKFVKG